MTVNRDRLNDLIQRVNQFHRSERQPITELQTQLLRAQKDVERYNRYALQDIDREAYLKQHYQERYLGLESRYMESRHDVDALLKAAQADGVWTDEEIDKVLPAFETLCAQIEDIEAAPADLDAELSKFEAYTEDVRQEAGLRGRWEDAVAWVNGEDF